ncbi:hypothetical protein J2S10_005461 [Neobacillus ginsengisoli]|uniref:Uncharacterized protein n=1 Tax=Neobacillus ginsengisoli TaxID=904295 RepID=A0ABT9Y4X2_9BACI|nr:hypothetical protein [Neobacillus ginsengisoli]
MGNIIWINGSYKEDSRVFDSDIQAQEWADALLPDFGPYLISQINVGYATPDEKVIKYLGNLLPDWASYNNVKICIHQEKTIVDGQVLYKIWTQHMRQTFILMRFARFICRHGQKVGLHWKAMQHMAHHPFQVKALAWRSLVLMY